jgi:hypothetical protein
MSQVKQINVNNTDYKLTASQIVSDQGIPGYTTTVPTTTAEDGAVAFVLTSESAIIRTKTFTITNTVLPASSGISVNIDITLSGYTPVGLIGWYGSGTSKCFMADFRVKNSTTATIYPRNITTSETTISSISIGVLYVKDGFAGNIEYLG